MTHPLAFPGNRSEALTLHPDLMEPWVVRIETTDDREEQIALMRKALGATFRARYPMPKGFYEHKIKAGRG